MIYVPSYAPHRPLLSFPTRRSSDLETGAHKNTSVSPRPREMSERPCGSPPSTGSGQASIRKAYPVPSLSKHQGDGSIPHHARSEEHTSELQSRGHLVCRLLLEKKNN